MAVIDGGGPFEVDASFARDEDGLLELADEVVNGTGRTRLIMVVHCLFNRASDSS